MVNTGAANFLLITPDARGAGIGGAGVARTENDNAIFYNGATVLADNNHKGGATYSFIPWMRNYKSGYSLHTIGGFYKMDSRNAFLAGFRYYNYPKFTVMQGVEKTGEKIQPRELAVDIGYAREILSNLALSATLRYIYSDMGNVGEAGASGAIAFDIGAFYKNDIVGIQEGNWGLGIHISNISSKIKYLDRKENLPAMAKLGGMVNLPFSLIHRLLINVYL
ncbi:MAG: PorV/PorQ family protein [Odoribacter sp.]|nr:PorV/PorQ family protein [Odoribacter sp.]